MSQVSYSQHFNFFITYKWVHKGILLHYTKVERLARNEHSSLLGTFVSVEKNEVL
jgi:hypothetical protein